MSFADLAGTRGSSGPLSRGRRSTPVGGSTNGRQAIESATLKLEQFQRQVMAIKRAANYLPESNAPKRTTGGLIDDDLHDRIRFACLLQEEIAKCLATIPLDSANTLLKRKLCKDFDVISTQLETSVTKISAREQTMQDALRQEQQEKTSHQGPIVAEHQGQVIQFKELENEIAHNEALIEEREKDIERIHQSVAQVNEIFRDLAAIVQEQQASIDDIETHVNDSLQQTQQGLDEVRKASEMQRTCTIQ
jgi:hypothetical protein